MIKLFILFIYFLISLLPVFSQTTSKGFLEDTEPSYSTYFVTALGVDVPGQNWQSAYSLGTGGKWALGLNLGGSWAVQLDMALFHFDGSAGQSDTEVRLIPELRYSLIARSDLFPYLLAGTGPDIEFVMGPWGNSTLMNWDLLGGFGIEWTFLPHNFFFIEGQCNFIFAYGLNGNAVTGNDIPILLGYRSDL